MDVASAASVLPVSSSKAPVAATLVAPPKFVSNQLPPNILAELQVCSLVFLSYFCSLLCCIIYALYCRSIIVLYFFGIELPTDNAALQDATGLHLGAPVATIKRNAQGVVTGFREAKVVKPGDGLMRRCEVQVRLNLDNSSVYLYPDQLNVLSYQQHIKQNQQQPIIAQLRVPPQNPAKEPRTLDAAVVNAAVRFPTCRLQQTNHTQTGS